MGVKIHGETMNLVVMQFNFMLSEHDVLLETNDGNAQYNVLLTNYWDRNIQFRIV